MIAQPNWLERLRIQVDPFARKQYEAAVEAEADAAFWAARAEAAANDAPIPTIPVGEIPEANYLCTDQANANRIQNWFGKRLVVCAGAFWTHDGKRWVRDEAFAARCAAQLTALVKREAEAARIRFNEMSTHNKLALIVRDTGRRDKSNAVADLLKSEGGKDIYDALMKAESLEKWAKQCESEPTQERALKLLRKMLTIDASEFDRDPMLLNCANGTVDLRTGTLKPHDPNDLITKLIPINFNPDAKAPRWERFLSEIFDLERRKFAQRWVGYCSTGDMREQRVLLAIGEGSNGKGVFFDVIDSALGDYAGTAPASLMTGKSDKHPTEVASLFGKRHVTVHESDERTTLREALIKQISGGDKIAARFLYRDFFTFAPTFKLTLITNYKPVVRGQDHGIWRRLLLLHFGAKFGTAAEVKAGIATKLRDDTLKQTLLATEQEGVLAWIVTGAGEWYRHGLQIPDSMLDDSVTYRREQDRVGSFINEQCVLDPKAWSSYDSYGRTIGLYPAYVSWCKDSGHEPLNKTNFINRLEQLVPHFKRHETKQTINGLRRSVWGCYGLCLIDDPLYAFDKSADSAPPDDNQDLL